MPIAKTFRAARAFDLSVTSKQIAKTLRDCGYNPSVAALQRMNNAFAGTEGQLIQDDVVAWYRSYLGVTADSAGGAIKVLNLTKRTAPESFVFNNSTSTFLSTPDSVASSVTGSIDIRVKAALDSWQPAGSSVLCGKWGGAGRAYNLGVLATGALQLLISADGSATKTATSTAFVPYTAGATGWVRTTYNSGTGEVLFYTSTDGVTWVQLGASVSIAAGAIFDTTDGLRVGINGFAAVALAGIVYQVQILNGINGPVVALMDPRQASETTTTWTSGTGEVWTINGGAQLVGNYSLFQNTASARPAVLGWDGLNYGYLNGVAGNYYSTPDSTAVDITGDLDLRILLAMPDWTPSADSAVLSKYTTTGNQRSYRLAVLSSSGQLFFQWSADGVVASSATSTAAPTVSDGQALWVRVTLDVDNGAAGNTVTFYTSTNGVTWTQLGTPVVGVGTTSLFVSTAVVEVGSLTAGTLQPLSARVFRAQVYNGIGGTLVADFNPGNYVTGTTFVAATGETWTLNGASTIVNGIPVLYLDGSNDSMKSAAFALTQPQTIYILLKQLTTVNTAAIYDGNATDGGLLGQTSTSGQINVYAGTSGISANGTLGAYQIHTAIFNGVSSSSQINNITAATGNAGANNMNGFTLGTVGGGGSRFGNFQFVEVIVCRGVHDSARQAFYRAYLARVAGLSI